MSDGFDYKAPDVPETTVSDIASEIKNQGKLPPLTPEQIEQRKIDAEIYQWVCHRRDEERRAEHERKLAKATAAAERERRDALERERTKARLERHDQIAKETRERELRSLQRRVAQQEWWQRSVDNAAARQQQVQRRQALIADLDRMINPPPPPPTPEPSVEVVYEEKRDPTKLDWPQQLNRWFER
jgi:hypothetical protein